MTFLQTSLAAGLLLGGLLAGTVQAAPVTIQPGNSQADFTVVSDPITVPYTKAHADEDYTILVGFDEHGQSADPAAPRKTRRKRG